MGFACGKWGNGNSDDADWADEGGWDLPAANGGNGNADEAGLADEGG